MGGAARTWRVSYRGFVEEGLRRELESPWEMIQWQSVLGSESFVGKIQDRMQGKEQERAEVTALRQAARPPKAMKILRKVARRYRLPVEGLRERGGYGLEARNVAISMVWENCGMSLREIGELFGGLSYAAVAQRLRRLDPKAKQMAARLS